MTQVRTCGKKAVSILLCLCIVFSLLIFPAVPQAQALGTVGKGVLGIFSTFATAAGPALAGKTLNAMGLSGVADYMGLNTGVKLNEIMESVDEIKETVGTVTKQLSDLSKELTSMEIALINWTTLTTFQSNYGGLRDWYTSNLQTLQLLEARWNEGMLSDGEYAMQLKTRMTNIYHDGEYVTKVRDMGNAIMGQGTALESPTATYYRNMMQRNGITRDELIEAYVNFGATVYQDYAMSVLLCNGAMKYLSSLTGGNTLYELEMVSLSEQAQEVANYLVEERERLFPADSIDGYTTDGTVDGPKAALPSDRAANDYIVTYNEGVAALEDKHTSLETTLSEYYLALHPGESTAVKVFDGGHQVMINESWATGDARVAVVDSLGGVTAVGTGSTILTVTVPSGESLQVQVEVVARTEGGENVTTAVHLDGEKIDADGNATGGTPMQVGEGISSYSLEDITGMSAEELSLYTWESSDPLLVTVSGTAVTSVGKSGGYGLVIGSRRVRYDTDFGNSFYAYEKIVIPFCNDKYTNTIYDYDDLLMALYTPAAAPGTLTLAANLTADSVYGKICAETKLRQPYGKTDGRTPLEEAAPTFTFNGGGHSIDVMGTTFVGDLGKGTVENTVFLSSVVMDSAAVAERVGSSGAVKSCTVNVDIVANAQYVGGAANTAKGYFYQVSFLGTITNTYDTNATPKSAEENGNTTGNKDLWGGSIYDTGTGGIVGRLDVTAAKSSGNWSRTTETQGLDSCYFGGEVTAAANAGGMVGIAVGAWDVGGSTWLSGAFPSKVNAAYAKVLNSVSAGEVHATKEAGTGSAGGVAGLSLCADIWGAVNTSTVTASGANSFAAGISGLYYPLFHSNHSDSPWKLEDDFHMRAVLTWWGKSTGGKINTAGGTNRDSAWHYNPSSTLWSSHRDHVFEKYYFGNCEDAAAAVNATDAFNSKITGSDFTGVQTLKTDGSNINNGFPVFATTPNSGGSNQFSMPSSFEYGEAVVPTTAVNVVKYEYAQRDSGTYSEMAPTQAGSYTVRVTFVNGSTQTANFTITPRAVILADPGETDLAYTGKTRTVKSPYITNLISGDSVELVVEGNTGTEKGSYTLKVTGLTGADAANYQVSGTYEMAWSITDKTLPGMVPSSISLSSSIPSTDWIYGVPVTVGAGDAAVTLFTGTSFRLRDLVQVMTHFDDGTSSGSMSLDVDAQGTEWEVLSPTTLSIGKNDAGEAVATVLAAGVCEFRLKYTVQGQTRTSGTIIFTVRDARYPVFIDFGPTDAVTLSLDSLHGDAELALDQYTITATDQYDGDYTGDDIQWVSTNTSVAEIENGKLVANGEGTTILKLVWGTGTAKRTESESSVAVTVNAAAVPETLTLSISERTLYYNLSDGREKLDVSDDAGEVTWAVKDQFGDAYTPKEGESLTWSFKPATPNCADFAGDVLTAKTNGSGTLTATFASDDGTFTALTADIAVTTAAFHAIQSVSYSAGADYVRLGQEYDLTKIPLAAKDTFGNDYTLSQAEIESITWSFDSDLSQNFGVTAAVARGRLTVTAASLDDEKEDSIWLDGAVGNGAGGTVTFRAKLTIREIPALAEISIAAEESLILRPQAQLKISDYITVEGLDQYGDAIALEDPVWASNAAGVLSVVGNTHLQGVADGTAKLTLRDGAVTSNPIAVTVASAPYLARIEITNAPASLALDAALDLGALEVDCYDQLDQPWTETVDVSWNVLAQGTGAQLTSDTALTSGDIRGKFQLQASVNTTIVDTADIYVGPQTTALSPATTTLNSTGGTVTFTLTGEHLTAGIVLGLFPEGSDTAAATAETALSGGRCRAALAVPENVSEEADAGYTVKISYDGGTSYEATIRGEIDGDPAPTATVTVLKVGSSVPITPPGGGGGTVTKPDDVTTGSDGAGNTVTTAIPDAEISGTTASAAVDTAMGREIAEQAKAHGSQTVVIAPEIPASAARTEISIPSQTLLELGNSTQASLTLKTPAADVGLPNEALAVLGAAGGTTVISTERTGNTVTLEVQAGGAAVDTVSGGVKLTVPYAGGTAGTVAVAVHADGSRAVIPKSIAGTDGFLVLADGPGTIEICDNSRSYEDVFEADWYDESVDFVSSHEMFYGVSETLFSPNSAMTRGMLMTVLARYDGQDTSGGENWYDAGVNWAMANGISDGTMPEESVTREQIVTILYRYAGSPAVSGSLDFPDADSVSDYARDALVWATENNIIVGHDTGLLDPRGEASRAQVAAIVMRFCEYEIMSLPF